MLHLPEQLSLLFHSRLCLVGVGNVDSADDGFGVRLVERLMETCGSSGGMAELLSAQTTPERHLMQLSAGRFDHVLFLDAVEFGGVPGDVLLLDAGQIAAHFPQVSTHRISLGLLAELIEAGGKTKAWLLGVQPASLKRGQPLSEPVRCTSDLLAELIMGEIVRSA